MGRFLIKYHTVKRCLPYTIEYIEKPLGSTYVGAPRVDFTKQNTYQYICVFYVLVNLSL